MIGNAFLLQTVIQNRRHVILDLKGIDEIIVKLIKKKKNQDKTQTGLICFKTEDKKSTA